MCRMLCVVGVVALLAGRAAAQNPVPQVTAEKLVELFQTNEIAAEDAYAGKTIEVTGKFVRVSRFAHGTAAGEDTYVLELDVGGKDVGKKCDLDLLLLFDEKQRATLARLKPGDNVVVRGECGKRTLWSGDHKAGAKDYSQMQVKKCSLVESKASAK